MQPAFGYEISKTLGIIPYRLIILSPIDGEYDG